MIQNNQIVAWTIDLLSRPSTPRCIFLSANAADKKLRAFRPIDINTKVPGEEQALLRALPYLYLHRSTRTHHYSIIDTTLPEPTVLPPSRIAKRRPCSIATGWISSTVISTLSPGIHISTPSGRSQTPVTSVVLK